MKNDFELFNGKSMSSLFQDIYNNQTTKKLRISDLINNVTVLIKTPGDTITTGPLLSNLLDTSVRNDEQLLKMAQIAQKIMASDSKSESDTGILTLAEKAQLLLDIVQTNTTDDIIDELVADVKQMKK